MPKQALPRDIDVLDLFCGTGQRLVQLAKRHPKKVFVGVDKAGSFLRDCPPNVFLVRQDALEFLRTRKQAGSVHHVNVDFGLHFLKPGDLAALYRHVVQLLHPNGRMYISTYSDSVGASSRLVSQAEQAGLRLTRRRPLINKPGASTSLYTKALSQPVVSFSRFVDNELVAAAGAGGVSRAVRLMFRKRG